MSDVEPVAIIGLALRIPGASNPEAFWQNIIAGRESISRLSRDELLESGESDELISDPCYVPAKGLLDDIYDFDADYFRFSPREAELLDPQHRVFLEVVFEALQDSGYDPERTKDKIGLFAGSDIGAYGMHLLAHDITRKHIGVDQILLHNEKDYLATRIAYKLNLKGPAVNVQTACSTSLSAVHLACESLRRGECEVAVAGGVRIEVPHRRGYIYEPGNIQSSDGHCRVFQRGASGTVSGSGAAVVVLKKLSEAIKARDHISCVIRSSAINNDGHSKAGFSAPSVAGQVEVITRALEASGIAPKSLGLVEAHGTGTVLGDLVEVTALKEAFTSFEGAMSTSHGWCALTSVKANVGHLGAASGIVGLIKAVLSVKNACRPKMPDVGEVIESIIGSPFYVPRESAPWPAELSPRRAAVSSFGIGGTNVHAIVEEAPAEKPIVAPAHDVLILSAEAPATLSIMCRDLANALKTTTATIADVANTLQFGRREHPWRFSCVPAGIDDAISLLDEAAVDQSTYSYVGGASKAVTFVFHQCSLAEELWNVALYGVFEEFTQEVDRLAPKIRKLYGRDLLNVIRTRDTASLNAYSESEKYAVWFTSQYALAKQYRSFGIRPDVAKGNGTGIFAAAALAGVLSPYDALTTLSLKGGHGTLAQRLEQRGYLSELQPVLLGNASIPIYGPGQERLALHELNYVTDLLQIVEHSHPLRSQKAGLPVGLTFGADENIRADRGAVDSAERYNSHMLLTLSEAWRKGVHIDWAKLKSNGVAGRVSLPSYPLHRKKYYYQPPSPEKELPHKLECRSWLHEDQWSISKKNNTRAFDKASDVLIVVDDGDVHVELEKILRDSQHRCVLVFETNAIMTSAGKLTIDVGYKNYSKLFQELAKSGFQPERIWWLRQLDGNRSKAPGTPASNCYEIVEDLRQLLVNAASAMPRGVLTVYVLTNDVFKVNDADYVRPEKAAITSMCYAAQQEHQNVIVRIADMDKGDLADQRLSIQDMLQSSALNHPASARRHGTWLTQNYNHVYPLPDNRSSMFKQGGHYLLMGGTGKIGLLLSEWLVSNFDARLELVGLRTIASPPKGSEPSLRDQTDNSLARSKMFKRLATNSGKIRFHSADLTSIEEMRCLWSEISREGVIDGIIHAVGPTHAQLTCSLDDIEEASWDEQFRLKGGVLENLVSVIKPGDNPFIVVFSSLAVQLGGIGLAAYGAANAHMEALVENFYSAGGLARIVAWDAWDLPKGRYPVGIGSEVSSELFSYVFDARLPLRVMVSPRDMSEERYTWLMKASFNNNSPAVIVGSVADDASVLDGIRSIWSDIFGVELEGVEDDFFLLGGDSLMLVRLVSRVCAQYKVKDLSRELFACSTVRDMAQAVGNALDK